jgi:ankyrin repeat protein
MEQLFSDRECLEEMRFSTIHRIVLGLSSTSLETHISQNPESINTVDSNGRTPLSWAAQRGMVEVVKTLLHFGADPNICTPRGHSPLLYATEARTPSCLMPLLGHGADVTQCDVEGQTALHYAAGHRGDLAYYRPLIEANSDPNRPTIPGMTPLTTVILEGFNEAMKYLVENGADINLKGHDGRSPVFYAVEYNNQSALQFLQDKRADFTGESIKYPTIAHVAAHHANVETLRILTSFSLTLRDIDCVDSEGLTIPQIVDKRLQSRPESERDLIEAFGVFLGSVKTGEAIAAGPESARHVVEELEEEEFHDALEEILTN